MDREFIDNEAGKLMRMYNLIREMKKKTLLNPPLKGKFVKAENVDTPKTNKKE